jgi:sodium/bile acid cotransporter 7
MNRLRIDPFVLALLAVVALAYFFPQWGSTQGGLPLDRIAGVGISLIFFFYGLKLGPEKLRLGLRNWKLHVLIQLCTFLLFPLIVIAFYPLVQTGESTSIWLAFLFLAALPSTVSFSVVMVTVARGNVPGAIFNASISGLIGIVVTPLWMGFFLKQAAGGFNLGEVYMKLLTEILLPVIAGLLLQKYFGRYVVSYSTKLALFDKSVILLIIYKSFARSFEERVFSAVAPIDLLWMALAAVALFFLVFWTTGFLSRYLGFNTEDRITAQFCGSKKSLVHGTVFAKILFPMGFPIGIIFLPLMLFHAFQILAVSILAARLAKRKEE